MQHLNKYLTYDECEAAMCLWEECLWRMNFARKEGGMSAQEEVELWVWLKHEEGASMARDWCMHLAPDIERCYLIAREKFGFDDSFDWEFVPRWADEAMAVDKAGHFFTETWLTYIAYKVTYDWRQTFP